MKLSKAQQMVLDSAKKEIDRARNLDYPDWLKMKHPRYQRETEKCQQAFKEAVEKEEHKQWWEEYRKGIVLTHCSSHTIRALERLGLIEIIKDSAGSGGTIDQIKVLNY